MTLYEFLRSRETMQKRNKEFSMLILPGMASFQELQESVENAIPLTHFRPGSQLEDKYCLFGHEKVAVVNGVSIFIPFKELSDER